MNEIIREHREYAVEYIDNVALFFTAWEQYIERLRHVLDATEQTALKTNPHAYKLA